MKKETKDIKSGVNIFRPGTLLIMSIFSLVMVNRKLRKSKEPSVSFSNKPSSSENQNRMAATLSPVYEDISHDANKESLSRDNVGPTPSQSGQTSQTQSDYINTLHPAEVDQEKVNDYDRLDVDVVGEGSPYTKIET